jgi:hypothetical protein
MTAAATSTTAAAGVAFMSSMVAAESIAAALPMVA